MINQVASGLAQISAEDLKELQEIFHIFMDEVLALKSEISANNNREEAFGKVVDLLLEQRQAAKAAKDWVTSDKIRDNLAALGFEIKDGKEGSEWKLNK
jgi:cysteinyl-tRNA synthetase